MHSGILLLDKPGGVTSFEVVRRARRALKLRKIGHLGTLDPFATGLLPLCLQEATKLVPFLMPEPKTYQAMVLLGATTDTQDLTGEVVARSDALPSPEEVRRVAQGFVGEIEQTPPMYSALHHQGQRLYKLARRGEVVDLRPRKVVVHHLNVDEVDLPRVTLTVKCSQGTYIRTLAHDLGRALGCGGHLIALRRLMVGHFRVEESIPMAALTELSADALHPCIIRLAHCLTGLRIVTVLPEEARLMRQGRPIIREENRLASGEQVRIMCGLELVAVARLEGRSGQAVLAPVRVFAPDA
jgi:tRNA pseudouridine55 synthase